MATKRTMILTISLTEAEHLSSRTAPASAAWRTSLFTRTNWLIYLLFFKKKKQNKKQNKTKQKKTKQNKTKQNSTYTVKSMRLLGSGKWRTQPGTGSISVMSFWARNCAAVARVLPLRPAPDLRVNTFSRFSSPLFFPTNNNDNNNNNKIKNKKNN